MTDATEWNKAIEAAVDECFIVERYFRTLDVEQSRPVVREGREQDREMGALAGKGSSTNPKEPTPRPKAPGPRPRPEVEVAYAAIVAQSLGRRIWLLKK